DLKVGPYDSISEVELNAEFRESRHEDRLRPAPGRIDVAFSLDCVGIQRVVDIEVDRRAPASPRQELCDPEIELVQAIAIHGSGIDNVDRDVLRSAREIAAERLAH